MREDTVVLIAEDDAGHFALVKKNLWRMCATNAYMHFRNGQEVLDFLFRRGGGPEMTLNTPYVLLLDIRMPKVEGIEVLRQIKADPQLRKIPVMMLTTTSDPIEVQRCYDAGCSFYIVKPSDYSEFMACVEHIGELLSLEGVQVPLINPSDSPSADLAGHAD